MIGVLAGLIRAPSRVQKRRASIARYLAIVLGASTVALLGVSGWFIAAAAGVGVLGLAAAQTFNYLLPSAAIRLLAIGRTGARYGERLLGHETALLATARVRPALFDALSRCSPSKAFRATAGDASTLLIQDVQAIELRLVQRTAIWNTVSAALVGWGLVAIGGWPAAAATAACWLALLGGAKMIAWRADLNADAVHEATVELKQRLALLDASREELRCYGLEERASGELAAQASVLVARQCRQAVIGSGADALQAALFGMAMALAVWLSRAAGAPLAALAGLAAAMTIEGAAPWVRLLLQSGASDQAARRLEEWLARPHADDPATRSPAAATRQNPAVELASIHEAPWRHGMRVAITGDSGSGKTTLIETLLGFRDALPGTIFVGGADVASMSVESLRKNFSWLPEDAALLTGTVRDNLSLAGDSIDEPAMWQALHDAVLEQCVRQLPQGLDTWLGERGVRLSGGETRRLALARAYLVAAPWLLLDEPTEGLDAATECKALRRLAMRLAATGQGMIVVTHRRAVIEACELQWSPGSRTRDAPDPPTARQLAVSRGPRRCCREFWPGRRCAHQVPLPSGQA